MDAPLKSKSWCQLNTSEARTKKTHNHQKVPIPIVSPALTPATVSISVYNSTSETPPASSSCSSSSSSLPSLLDIPDETTASQALLSSLSLFSLLSPLSSSSSSTPSPISSSFSSLNSVSPAPLAIPWPLSTADKVGLSKMELGSSGCSRLTDGGSNCSDGRDNCLTSHTNSPAEPESCESVLGLAQGLQSCPASTIQCLSSVSSNPGEQVLSDQLLGSSAHTVAAVEVTMQEEVVAAERALCDGGEQDAVNEAAQSIYEGLGVEETQDWSCLESLISESRMELLDLCSRSELAVNLFCEEDVESYMFQEEDPASLAADVCSLKIRYEAFQDGAQEHSNDGDTLAPVDAQHLGFFPTCTRRETTTERLETWETDKGDALSTTPITSPTSQSLFDFSSSPGESAEFSDDDSSCIGSSPDTWLAKREHGHLSRENSSSSSQLSYRLRAKRKVAFRDDYLYDMDSIESERNAENRAGKKPVRTGLKGEKDDDWCPKKKRKSHRKDPPVIIKYIIINRFKGVKHMTVRLGRVNPDNSSVCLNEDSMTQYEKLAPLKAFWQNQTQDQHTLNTKVKHINGCKLSPSSGLKKRRHKMAKRLKIQRIQALEKTDSRREIASTKTNTFKLEGSREKVPAAERDTSAIASPGHPMGHGPGRRVIFPEPGERDKDGNPARIRKFRSEAQIRASKLAEALARQIAAAKSAKEREQANCESCTSHLQNADISASSTAPEKSTLISNSPGVPTPAQVAPLPGGYLQTLLEASDSSNNTCTPYFELAQQQQQQSQTFLLGVPFQPPQSCVLSPPSESELPQSPHNQSDNPNDKSHQGLGYVNDITHSPHATYQPARWPSQPEETAQHSFPPTVPTQSPMILPGFSKHVELTTTEQVAVTGYHAEPSFEDGQPSPDEPLRSEQPLQQQQLLDLEFRLSPSGTHGDVGVGRLVSFDSLGSLSVASSNYSSLSVHEGEGEAEEGEMSDNFLSHCSPQLVLQQSLEEVTPLRESTDLLDISNFTPDKFRHVSLSDMSPPETPSPSPQLIRQGPGFTPEPGSSELPWDCGVVSSEVEDENGSRHTHLLQIHSFGPDDEDEEESNGQRKNEDSLRGERGSKRRGAKAGPKKSKSLKAARGEQNKSDSKCARKIKAILEGKSGKGVAGSQSGMDTSIAPFGHTGEWSGGGDLCDDDQQEFKEPSNILSNIVSGMAEVQRFMRASVEPLWSPCPPAGEQSLQSQTLKILGGPFESGKKRGGPSGAGRGGKKGTGRGGKTPPKLIPADFFPTLGLDYFPVPHRPAHKKMYRHKSSAKFARQELSLGKGNTKVSALTATLEKQR